jgi:hypothetical protein
VALEVGLELAEPRRQLRERDPKLLHGPSLSLPSATRFP